MVTANDSENKLAKIRWACRRGMLELELMLQRFCDTTYLSLSPEKQALFAELLESSDQDLQRWLLGMEAATPKFQDMILIIRHMHATAAASV